MAYTKTDIANMGDEFAKILLAYNKDVTEATQKAVEEVAQGVQRTIKSHITWNDKTYSKSFDLKTIYKNERGEYIIWHVKSPDYKLTHLLELGHYTRDGKTKSRKFPHVQYGAEYVVNNLYDEIKKGVEQQ